MKSNQELKNYIESIVGENIKVYLQPPTSMQITYPCIKIDFNKIQKDNANNMPYKKDKVYTLTLIHDDLNNDIVDKLVDTMCCTFDNHYQKDNLHYYVFTFID